MTSNPHYKDPRNAANYDRVTRSLPVVVDDIPFYAGLAREAAAQGQDVLELGCGTGRVTIPMAQAGARVTGVDSARPMLEIARHKAAEAGVDVRWLEADMASFDLGKRFGLVAIPFRSFLLLLTTAEQQSCLACVCEHLVDGGVLALNFFNPDPALIARSGSDDGLYGPLITRAERNLRLRYVLPDEMRGLLTDAGFEVEALYGWFDRRPFDDDSEEMVWLARRAY